jgi:hypothetical protein
MVVEWSVCDRRRIQSPYGQVSNKPNREKVVSATFSFDFPHTNAVSLLTGFLFLLYYDVDRRNV